jgi:hypothetical protein
MQTTLTFSELFNLWDSVSHLEGEGSTAYFIRVVQYSDWKSALRAGWPLVASLNVIMYAVLTQPQAWECFYRKCLPFTKNHVLCLVFFRKELNTRKHSRESILISWVIFSLFTVSGKFLWYVCYRIFVYYCYYYFIGHISIYYIFLLLLFVSVY